MFMRLWEELQAGRRAVLLTVVDSTGSTPRAAGSHQLVREDGTTVGTIGGGFQEYKACERGRENLQEETSSLFTLILHPNEAADIGAVCGGELQVFSQFLSPRMPGAADCVYKIAEAIRTHQAYWLMFNLTDTRHWAMALLGGETNCFCGDVPACLALREYLSGRLLSDRTGLTRQHGLLLYREALSYPGQVFVFGGGHVALALVPLLTQLGFACAVVDDREEFANSRRFPQAAVFTVDLQRLPDEISVTPDDYVCIMTRGHVCDYAVQRQVLPQHPCYLGVIGSRNKLAFVKKKLLADGFSPAEIDACYAPIGLPISAATPEEIAVSIAAELIAVRARREKREKAGSGQWLRS
ncbi:XdhC family protein [Megasphaera cerevisiae]|uniref:XdhC family protein n=1 Tax=Megasphaera cerevisiae TaxID=39029 RepID=UPI00209ACA3E|nr:XdhC/CoxI family protein [Megasphaera cerevisiae]